MEKSIKSPSQELSHQSFFPVYSKADNVLISFGPKNGLLWRGESIDSQEMSLIGGLNRVFQQGFTQRDEQSVLARLPYLRLHYPYFICASNTYCNGNELTGWNNEQASAGDCGYVYLIDSSYNKSVQSIPLCEENVNNSNFVAGYNGEINEGPDYAVISALNPAFIVGAIPSKFVAFALGLNEKCFIINPFYCGVIYLDKINEISGISQFLKSEALSLKYPELSIDQTYQRYLLEKHPMSADFLSLPITSYRGVNFFQTNDVENANVGAVLPPEPSASSSDNTYTQYPPF